MFLLCFFNTNENRNIFFFRGLTKCWLLCSSFSAWIWKGNMRFQNNKNNAISHMCFIFSCFSIRLTLRVLCCAFSCCISIFMLLFRNKFPVSCISCNFWSKNHACRWFKEVEGEKQHVFKRTCGKHFQKHIRKVHFKFHFHHRMLQVIELQLENIYQFPHTKASKNILHDFFDVTCPPSFILRF